MFPDFLQHLDVHIDAWASGLGYPTEAIVRLLLAAVAGGLVGLEREMRGRQAGFRTNILVCVGSALTMLVSVEMARHHWIAQTPNQGVNINVDPARIAYSVMSGIGFLGAGAIIKSAGNVRGLTTAAGLWCVAAIGLACGFGMYTLAVIAATMVVTALWLLEYLEGVLPRLAFREVVIRRTWTPNCVHETVEQFRQAGLDVDDASFERSPDLHDVNIRVRIAFTSKDQYYNFERRMESETNLILLAAEEV